MPCDREVASLLDTDMYKFTMQNAIFLFYKDADVEYKFYNRTPKMVLNEAAVDWIKRQIDEIAALRFTEDEIAFLSISQPVFTEPYLDFLRLFRLLSSQVSCNLLENGDLDITVHGKWAEVIMWEVPLLALISTAYFKFVDTDWSYEGQMIKACRKTERLMLEKCTFSEFGTRRRRDYRTHSLILQGILKAEPAAVFVGTSNVHFAHVLGLKPIGTVAHEWTMGIAALHDSFNGANGIALKKWVQVYGDKSGIALTDTFGTDAFLKDFDIELARYFIGVRHDSADPATFVKQMSLFYRSIGIDPETMTICFSDGLTVDRCIALKSMAEGHGFTPLFGIGTHFTNDFTSSKGIVSKPMNIVIKLSKAGGRYTVKLSDELAKNTGDPLVIAQAKHSVGIT